MASFKEIDPFRGDELETVPLLAENPDPTVESTSNNRDNQDNQGATQETGRPDNILPGPNSDNANKDSPTGTGETAFTSATSSTANTTLLPPVNSNSGGSGLSKGAIAGIAVGAVMGVLLIAGLIFWFWFRRRPRARGGKGAYGEHEGASAAHMADKDASRAKVTDSPRSPYSDDGQVQQLPLHDLNNDSQQQSPSSYTPYNERPESLVGARATTGSMERENLSRRSTSRVAHLIEDGMTDDEIRRLEEEERQLDDEIARSGGPR